MIKFLIAITLLFAAPLYSHAKPPKCAKGDKACQKKAAAKKADKKAAKTAKKEKKADKKTAKKNKKIEKLDKQIAKKEKKKKQIKMDMPAADVNEPMPLPDNMGEENAVTDAPSPAPAATAAVTPPSPAKSSKGDLEDDIFPESSAAGSGSGDAAPATGGEATAGDDFLDDELPAE